MSMRNTQRYLPAKYPTISNPPVAAFMAPDMGGPTRAPSPTMLMNIPSRRPTSPVSPSAIMGLESKETYDPQENLHFSKIINAMKAV
jgi:hypothetical protein